MNDNKILPYGMWPSPVTASLISQRIRLDEVDWASDGETLIWSEIRSGSSSLVAQTGCAAVRNITGELSPRGGVGYGGGAFSASSTQNMIAFGNRDGRLYVRGLGMERPKPVTPIINPPAGVASPSLSPDGYWIAYVYSDGQTDLLALADTRGIEWPVQLARGADFYMQPTWHPQGNHLAWVEWDRPNMPWDGTRVQLARLEGSPPRLSEVRTVGGGHIPAQQPCFSPDGRWLSFIEESDEWQNIILVDLESGDRRVLVEGEGFEITLPAWVQGVRSIAWNYDSQRLYYIRYSGPNASLWIVDINNGDSQPIHTEPYTWLANITANPRRQALAMLASAHDQPQQVVRWEGDEISVVAYSTAATFDPDFLPTPRQITWDTTDGDTAHGLYYPPTSPSYAGDGAPPTILHIHGGPTSLASNGFNAEAAYFTSRGYAWVEVNYRGSTGYGRSYRHAMRERWGDVDVNDAASCARSLAKQGLADAEKLVITGGSAGGFTVLNTLERFPGLFKAGVCLYGVTNLYSLDLDTHKFEAHYNTTLVGRLPEAAARYQEWSPVFHADRIRDALYIFQGNEDKVVPPSQSEEIIAALHSRGIMYKYKLYEGEGHGFRNADTIADYLKEMERFLQQQVLFAP